MEMSLDKLMGDYADLPSPQEVTVTFKDERRETAIFDEIMLVEFRPGFVVFIEEDESLTAIPADEIAEVVAVTLKIALPPLEEND
ncbi:MAG: hypothetical protein Q8M92_01850 [Candidatus Subteraquimicrobiales bacterium]|nr:hypothetical protein [Candidatus Subteraquimicrobiales bacterium]